MAHHGDYSCCGCMHVRTGALVIGILVIIGGIFGILGSILNGIWPNIIGSAISIITGGLVIFADRTEREWGYLPYLVLNGIGIIIYTLVAIAFIILGIVVPSGIEDWFKGLDKNGDWKTAVRIACFIFVAIIIIGELLSIWFWSVVYRAYKYMKNVISCGTHHGYSA